MTVARWALTAGGTFAVFLVVDLLWLGVIARGVYRARLGHLMADDPNWIAAIVFYVIFVAGIFVFAIVPGLERDSASYTLRMAALFGFFTYATWDLTNLAVLKDFPTGIVFIDIPWGVVLTATVGWSGFQIAKLLGA